MNSTPSFGHDDTDPESMDSESAQFDGADAEGDASNQAWLPFPLKHPGMRAPLTATQKQVLDFIYEYRARKGVSPTLQEIGDHLKTHRVTVHAHVKALLDKKYLVRFSGRASRSLIPLDEMVAKGARENGDGGSERGPGSRRSKDAGAADAQLKHSSKSTKSESYPSSGDAEFRGSASENSESQGPLLFPLSGKIAAGRPIEATYDHEVLDVQALFPRERDLFVLEVVGDSMIEEQIRSGDYVVCEKRSAARNGEIVVAVLPTEFGTSGEATLKRFFREGKRIRLQPANRTMAPIYIEPPRQLEIRGVVVGVIRRYR